MIIGIDGNEANIKNRVGSGQFAFEVIRSLLIIDKKNSYKIYLKERPLDDLPKENDRLNYLVFGPKRFWTQLALPARLFFGEKPDVFFSPSHYAPRLSPCPRVVTVFDLSFIFFPELFLKSDLYQLESWTHYSVTKASAIITISNASKKDIQRHYNISQEKIFVAHPGYDKKLFKPVKDKNLIERIKKKYRIEGDYIFFLGTIQPRKNLVRLLEAVKDLRDIKLVIAGKKGWLYDEFFKKVEDMESKVIVTDYVEEKDLPALFSGAKAFVLPSLYEGFGIPVLEAMACGCPVVISQTSSLPEVGGDAAIYVNPNSVDSITDGILKVLHFDESNHRSIVEKSIKQAHNFSWEKCARVILEVLARVS